MLTKMSRFCSAFGSSRHDKMVQYTLNQVLDVITVMECVDVRQVTTEIKPSFVRQHTSKWLHSHSVGNRNTVDKYDFW